MPLAHQPPLVPTVLHDSFCRRHNMFFSNPIVWEFIVPPRLWSLFLKPKKLRTYKPRIPTSRYSIYWRGLDGRILSKRWGIITNGTNRKRFEISKSILCQWIENYFSSSAWLEKKQFLCKNAKKHFLLKSTSINLKNWEVIFYNIKYKVT